MATDSIIPVTESDRGRLEDSLKASDMSQAELARRVDRNPAAISRLVRGKSDSKQSTLRRISEVLDIPFDNLDAQLELEITPEFISRAESALRNELERLRSEVGAVPATEVTGSVGVQFYDGRAFERRSFERVFRLIEG